MLALLRAHLDAAGPQSAVVFLGDNVYPAGLPPIVSPDRAEAERRLDAQLDALRGYAGQVFFLPGNRDWQNAGPDGLAAVRREESYVEAALGRGDAFLPSDGLPGPAVRDLTDGIRLVALDSQWWLHPYSRATGEAGGYAVEEPLDVLARLQDVLESSEGKKVILALHHPPLSNGLHAGVVAPRYHLFPLTRTIKGAYVPLPVVGSILLFYNRVFGLSRQDLAHPLYQALREGVLDLIGPHDGLVVASGHEHSQQYFAQHGPGGTQHLVVSGSGSKTDYVHTGGGSLFASPDRGFSRLRYYADGSVWLDVWSAERPAAPLFTALLSGADAPQTPADTLAPPRPAPPAYRDSTVAVAINPDYRGGVLRNWFIGRGYRDAWTEPVRLPVLDLGAVAGGLTPRQRGGGAQTRSIRLEGQGGQAYTLRSVDKDPARALPRAFRNGLALDLAEEMTTAIQPFAAPAVAALAGLAGIRHTHPRIVFVPDDPRLGRYRAEFRNRVMLLEEIPGSGAARDTVVGPDELYRDLQADGARRVDGRAFLRARLFDLLVGDWDRHRGQWRWAWDEPAGAAGGRLYQPIPRDRDWALNSRDGLFFRLARPFVPKLQGLQKRYVNLNGLTAAGAAQDQRFLNRLSIGDWRAEAESLRVRLSDAAIDSALAVWPPEVRRRYGAFTARRLRARRDDLARIAERYYRTRARKVDVLGSDRPERFEVERLGPDSTRVAVFETDRQHRKTRETYRRVFSNAETEEVRLYGFGGDDDFYVEGRVARGLVVRLIGGTGEDAYVDASDVRRGLLPRTHIYDTPSELNPVVAVHGGPDTRFHRADRYPRLALGVQPQRYDERTPLVNVSRNAEDGLVIGGGYRFVRQGFLREPYARRQTFRANVAPLSGAVNAAYSGRFVAVLGGWDAGMDVAYQSPLSRRNFYGFGNNVHITYPDSSYYRTRMTRARVAPSLSRGLLGVARLQLQPSLAYTRFERQHDRFLAQPASGVPGDVFRGMLHAGLLSALHLDSRDNRVAPRRGFISHYTTEGYIGLHQPQRFVRLTADMTAFLTGARTRWLTLVPRVGFEHLVGDFPFYLAATLGGNGTLRGYRADRFSGRTALYQNVETRLSLRRFAGYVGQGEVGLYAFVDNGRVWADGESSHKWHQGYGGGFWLNALQRVVFQTSVAVSREDRLLTFGLGWFY